MNLSSNLLNGILESSKESVIFALDFNYYYLAFNENHRQTIKDIWGVDIQVGDNMLYLIKYQEDRNKAKSNFDRALNGESFTVVEQYGDESINRRWYQNEYNPLYDDNGDIIGLTVFLTDVTEREKSEENRKLSNKLIEDSPLGIFQTNSKGEYIDVNFMGCNILDYSKEEILNMHITDVLDKSYIDEGKKHFEKVLQTGYAQSVLLMRSKNGKKLWIDLSASKITEDRYIGYFKDITEEVRTKEKLIESESKNRAIIEAAKTVSLIVTDLNSIIQEFSPGAENIFGYRREEIIGKNVILLHKKSERQKLADYREKLKQDKEGFTIETEFIRKSGEVFPVRFTLQPLFDNEGDLFGLLGISIDISELKEAEIRFNQVTKNIDEVFWLRSADNSEILYISPAFEKVWGRSCDELYQNPELFIESVIDEDKEEVIKEFEKDHKDPFNNNFNLEYRIKRPDGSIKWVWARSFPVFDDNENLIRRAGVAVDITKLKEKEKELQEYNKTLEFKNNKINELYDRLKEEINKAEKVHKRLLPSAIDDIANVSIESYYQPAEHIGGDFYNVIRKGNKLVFYISDVTGHGLDGAIISTFIKECIDSYLELNPDNKIKPDSIIRHVCRQYRSQNYPDDYFISIFLGVLNLQTYDLRQTYDLEYIGMGFQEALLISLENGENLELNVEGLPITKAIPEDNITFNVKNIKLEPKTTLMINSDGLTEHFNEENEMFKEKLQEIFFANSHLPIEVLKSIINEEFRTFNNGDLQGFDDITYLLIKLDEDDMDFYRILDSKFEELDKLSLEIYNYFKTYPVGEIYFQGLKELVINAIEHGNKLDENKKVCVSFKDLKDKLIITVEDEGEGFNWRDIMDNKCLDLEGEKERGRGIAMTKAMCDSLFYNEKGNKAFLVLGKKEFRKSL